MIRKRPTLLARSVVQGPRASAPPGTLLEVLHPKLNLDTLHQNLYY